MPDARPIIGISDEVHDALAAGRPVVALESTLISHGLPQPQNLEVARRLESVVRAGGAAPATVGIINGRPIVGLSAGELETLATAPAGAIRKCGRRDIAVAVARGEHGATTVAGTLAVMGLAGLGAFLWSLRNGQYDDLDGAAERILLEEEPDDEGHARQER